MIHVLHPEPPTAGPPLTQADLLAFWSHPIAKIEGYSGWSHMYSAMLKLFIALRPNGYWNETGQGAFRIQVSPDADLAAVRAEVEMVLPHVIPFTFEEPGRAALGPVKALGVFEHTLRDPYSYALLIDAQSRPHLVNLSEQWTFADLDEALAYIQKHHWYSERAANAAADAL
jgi:hypothetical protein